MVSSRARNLKTKPFKAIQKSSFSNFASYPLGLQSRDLEDSKAGAAGAFAYISEVNNCLSSIVGGIQSLPWDIVRYEGGVREKGKQGEVLASSIDLQTRHPLQRALKRFQRRNNFDLFGTVAFDYTLYGTVAFEVAVNNFGWNPKLEWLNPLGIEVFAPSGKIDYIRFGWNNNYISYQLEELAYLHNRDVFNDFIGRPVVLSGLDKINILRNMDRFLRDYFNNNARPSLVVQPEKESSLSDMDYEKTKQTLRDSFKGVGSQYGTLILQKYLEITPLEQPDLVKNNVLSKEQADGIYEIFSVPRALRGNTAATAYKDGDETTRRFFLDAILPLAEIIQGYINTEFMPHYDIKSGQEVFEYDTSAFDLVTAADQLEATVVNSQVSGGYLTLAEAQRIQERPVDSMLENRYMFRGLPMTILQVNKLIDAEIALAETPPGGAMPPVGGGGGLGVGSPLGPREGEFMQRRLEAPKKAISTEQAQPFYILGYFDDVSTIVHIQDTLRSTLPKDTKFVPVDNLHVTLIYTEDVQFAEVQDSLPLNPAIISVIADGIKSFDTPDGFAIHLALRLEGSLPAVQAALVSTLKDQGVSVSEFSKNYKPHITLCTSSKDIVYENDSVPFPLLINRLELSDEKHDTLIVHNLKAFSEADVDRDDEGQFAEEGGSGDGGEEPEEELVTEEELDLPKLGDSSTVGTNFLPKEFVRNQTKMPYNAVALEEAEEWEMKLNVDEKTAISSWSLGSYNDFQALSEGKIEGISEDSKKQFADFETAVAAAPLYKGVTWRGFGVRGETPESTLANFKSQIGGSISFDNYASSSGSSVVATGFTTTKNAPVIFEIHSNQGHNINALSEFGGTAPDSEYEVLFQPGSNFRIRDAYIGTSVGPSGNDREPIFVILEDIP